VFAHAKAAKVGKGGLVIWDGLLVCWGWALSYFLWLVLKKQKQ
jgi:hypothetical protein